MRWRRPLLFLLFALPAAVAGCRREEDITSYDVPQPEREKIRLLAAIVPHGDRTWFVKIDGPDAELADKQKSFDDFVKSIQIDDKAEPPIRWTVPEGWKAQGATKMTLESFIIPARPLPLQATVSELGKFGLGENTLEGNINRWRKQINLPPIGAAQADQLAQREKVKDQEVFIVDMTGVGIARKPSRPMPGGGPGGAPPGLLAGAAKPPFRYEVPADWNQQAKPAGLSSVSFEVGAGKERAEITITALGGMAGGTAQNIARWRKQVGLPVAGEADILRATGKLAVAGVEAVYVDLASPPGDKSQLRILGVILPLGQTTWFVKMIGPPEPVGRQKANFEAFVKSFKLDME